MAIKAKSSPIQLPYDGGFTVYIDENGNAVCGIPPVGPWSGPHPYDPAPTGPWTGPEPYPLPLPLPPKNIGHIEPIYPMIKDLADAPVEENHGPYGGIFSHMPTPIAPIDEVQIPVTPPGAVPVPVAPDSVGPVEGTLNPGDIFTVYIDENGNAVCGTPPAGYGGGASEEAEPEIVCYIPPGTVHEYPGEFVPTISNPDSPVPPFHPVLGQLDTIATTEPVTPVDGNEEIDGGIICYIPPGAHGDMPYYDPTVKYDVTIKQAFDPSHPPVSSPLDDPFTLSIGPDGTIVCGDPQPDPVQAALDHFIYGNTGPKAPDVYEITSGHGEEAAHSVPTILSVDTGPALIPQTSDLVS